MANKRMKKITQHPSSSGKQTHTVARPRLTPARRAGVRKSDNKQCWRGCGETRTRTRLGAEDGGQQPDGPQRGQQKSPPDLAIPLRGLDPGRACVHGGRATTTLTRMGPKSQEGKRTPPINTSSRRQHQRSRACSPHTRSTPRGEVTPATAWTGRKHAQERSRAQKGRLLNYCPDVTHPEQTAGGCPGLARGWEWGWGAAQGGKTQP